MSSNHPFNHLLEKLNNDRYNLVSVKFVVIHLLCELQLCENRGSGIARVNLVVGNHKSFFGITHIIEFLKKDILHGIEYEVSMYPNTKIPNLIIEDFHSKRFRKYLTGTKSKNVLIVTEFLSGRDSVEINQFRREPFVTYLGIGQSVLLKKAPATSWNTKTSEQEHS